MPVSEDGVRQLWAEDAFLDSLVELAPEALDDLAEELDRSDIWWWLCASWKRMAGYGRKDLKATARNWVVRLRANEVLDLRDRADRGEFDYLLPEELWRVSG